MPFFGNLRRQRIWTFWRRVLHTCHHRTQVQAWLRLGGAPPPTSPGPTPTPPSPSPPPTAAHPNNPTQNPLPPHHPRLHHLPTPAVCDGAGQCARARQSQERLWYANLPICTCSTQTAPVSAPCPGDPKMPPRIGSKRPEQPTNEPLKSL
jgi:hypothetical protein